MKKAEKFEWSDYMERDFKQLIAEFKSRKSQACPEAAVEENVIVMRSTTPQPKVKC